MSAASIPCGMVRRVDEAADFVGDHALISVPVEGLPIDRLTLPGAGSGVNGGVPPADTPPPRLDADRAAILDWLKTGTE